MRGELGFSLLKLSNTHKDVRKPVQCGGTGGGRRVAMDGGGVGVSAAGNRRRKWAEDPAKKNRENWGVSVGFAR